jgi:hypothetical protein
MLLGGMAAMVGGASAACDSHRNTRMAASRSTAGKSRAPHTTGESTPYAWQRAGMTTP